ncbi:ABC transporter ATP-binding protein/permease [Mycolicibacterium smegmatis]|uniref:ABC transporter ATP-binding protein n=1 Tax=Mycolicibacterium smegmatis TaxID=1772 RepID=UPI0005D77AF0|nr:ABC transporter ATP-binding protein [Mycolicibacterium smegmatis]MDF1897696.1 ABC transporter ATP-binding protein [Mycolicibacterium smegmatis]MDF1904252.1 ABC transporter ATP-binding protein [Mycolicibacterium smegmatis]MDF1917773.1 ABC transporter ATP-binding protein [Mycolicibacterium smegmatis]MDF1923130.1 ABC transporter ATP-binding protein [Mycolicibacterium smegmatis]UAK52350.1 ABC transporter ATP-binding protein/permease [Mycolicibacterium smegmatis]
MADTTRTDLSWTGVRVLRRTVSRNLKWLTSGTTLIALHQLCEVSVPVLIGIIVDRAVATGSVEAIIRWIAVLAALFVVLTVVYRFGARLLMFAIARESHLLRVESSAKILDPLGIETDYKVGELLSISSDDADEVSYLLDYVPRIVGAVVGTVVCGAVLLSIHLPLGLMVLIGVPVVVFGLQLTAPMIARRVEDQQAEIGRATALATDLISGQRPLQGIGAQANAAARYRVASRRALTATLRAARIQSIHSGAAAAAGALAAMAVAVVAAYFAIRGSMTVGQLITVIGLAQFLIEPFSLLAVVPSWVAEARASANRVARVLSAPTRHSPVFAADPRDAAARLSVRNATHAGLKNLSFDVEPGEFVAVLTSDVRDAGALIDLLSGYQRAEDKGTVLVGGRRLDQIPLKERREHLLVEHHLSSLFSGTLETNLNVTGTDPRRGRVSVDDALQASCAVDVVDLHPDGLAHAVVERGASLSGGQRQRWTLARALLADPAVLVLHDPTTAIDTVTEQVIADGIRRLRTRAGRTTVVLTSSPALLAAADRVLLVIDGRLDSEGTHRDLVDAHSDYRDLVTR